MKGSKAHGKSNSPAAVVRRERANIRLAAQSGRPSIWQLHLLEDRGHGHCKEATRIRKQLEAEVPATGGRTPKRRAKK